MFVCAHGHSHEYLPPTTSSHQILSPYLKPPRRLVMWGWCQELGRPRSDSHEYGCCLSLPRLLWRNPSDPSRLFQVGKSPVCLVSLFLYCRHMHGLTCIHADKHTPCTAPFPPLLIALSHLHPSFATGAAARAAAAARPRWPRLAGRPPDPRTQPPAAPAPRPGRYTAPGDQGERLEIFGLPSHQVLPPPTFASPNRRSPCTCQPALSLLSPNEPMMCLQPSPAHPPGHLPPTMIDVLPSIPSV